ncbi:MULTISPECIES: hypothetical protein [Bacillaceae]|uniref:hypothetical protein n=1 Tax=Bacillaceae TaxID=186817 RepID=UPI003F85ADF2
MKNNVITGGRDCFFSIYHEFDEGLASLFNFETSHGKLYPYGSRSCLHNQARETYDQLPASKDLGSERGEDPADSRRESRARSLQEAKFRSYRQMQ